MLHIFYFPKENTILAQQQDTKCIQFTEKHNEGLYCIHLRTCII